MERILPELVELNQSICNLSILVIQLIQTTVEMGTKPQRKRKLRTGRWFVPQTQNFNNHSHRRR